MQWFLGSVGWNGNITTSAFCVHSRPPNTGIFSLLIVFIWPQAALLESAQAVANIETVSSLARAANFSRFIFSVSINQVLDQLRLIMRC
jgi:hypothetical protein